MGFLKERNSLPWLGGYGARNVRIGTFLSNQIGFVCLLVKMKHCEGQRATLFLIVALLQMFGFLVIDQ